MLGVLIALLLFAATVVFMGPRTRKDEGEMTACISQADFPCLQRLYEGDHDLNAHLGKDWTPLTFAASKGQLTTVQWLVDHGADVNHPVAGTTAIFWAAFAGNREVVQFLLLKGADPCWVGGKKYLTPREIATKKGFDAVARMLPACEN